MALELSTQTGSIMNHMMSRQTQNQPIPTVGMGATLLGWTDRYAATIIAVTDQIITVREDRAIRTDSNGASEMQEYTYKPDPDGRVFHYKFIDGAWHQVRINERTNHWMTQEGGYGLMIGHRDHYYDYSF